MRLALLILNGVATAFFLAAFAYTFLGRHHISMLARDFVTARTQRLAKPVVDFAEESIKAPLVRRLLSESQMATFEREIAEYRQDPNRYIASLTGQTTFGSTGQGGNTVLTKITGWKDKVRQHYNNVLGRLIWDLRIFAGSNLVAAALAMGLAYRANEQTAQRVLWISLLVLGAVAYSVYFYIDRFSFFRILFNSYLGWWYPALLAITFFGLYLKYGRKPAIVA